MNKKKILAIVGSASANSSNHRLVLRLVHLLGPGYEATIMDDLKIIPHFDPKASTESPPPEIIGLRDQISGSDGVIICTPEYVFSIPSGLKNLIEWCVATTVFSEKPVGLITASADGEKGHAELQLIMQTLTAMTAPELSLLIKGIKGKIDDNGFIIEEATRTEVEHFVSIFKAVVANIKS